MLFRSLIMSDNNSYPASVFNDYLSSLEIVDALILSALLTYRAYSDSDDSVSICLCYPANDERSEALCGVLCGLRDIASFVLPINYRFVFYVHTDDANLGAPLDIFRISTSSSFYALVSEHVTKFMRSCVY